jgi:glycerophosphoryl diester phosphodiesterase
MTKLVAHRGYSAHYPENTMIAARAAIAAGACGIELDVQMCADGRFVVMHDDNLLRTCGVDIPVFAHSLAELQTHSAHEAARFAERYFPEKVPSLQQMLNFIACCRGLTALVEVKEESLDHWGVEKVMDKLCHMLEPHSAQCVIISFSADAIAKVNQHGGLRAGWVLHKYDNAHQEVASELQPNFLICNQRKINTPELWSGDWQWGLYGVERAELAKTWAERGVALIETNHIAELVQHDYFRNSACRYD